MLYLFVNHCTVFSHRAHLLYYGKYSSFCFDPPMRNTVWPENLTGIKFDEIASKLHNKNMTDFNLTKCAVRRHIV